MPFGDEQCQQMLKYNRSSPLSTILTDACGRDDEMIVIINAKKKKNSRFWITAFH